tara:strand:- start:114 stop:506 length:393 start_codon:yes stop_codon:yes gene_type:complete
MKKLLLLSALLIFACSSDDSDTNGSNDNSFNAPTWIQGVWMQDNLFFGVDFRTDDFCNVQGGNNACYKALIELYANTPNFNTNVYEEISESRYYFVFTWGPNEYVHEYEKLSENTINSISSGQVTLLTKQ